MLKSVRILGLEIAIAWTELWTNGEPISHQAYGIWVESRMINPLFTIHCKPSNG